MDTWIINFSHCEKKYESHGCMGETFGVQQKTVADVAAVDTICRDSAECLWF